VRFQVLCGTELSSFQAACGSSPSSRHPYWRTIWPFWPNVYKCYLLYASRTYVNDTNAFGSTNLSISRWQSHLRINCKDGDRCYDFAHEDSKAAPCPMPVTFSLQNGISGERREEQLCEKQSRGSPALP
jgi:hypothetical protein